MNRIPEPPVTYSYQQPSPAAIDVPHASRKSRFLRAIARQGAGPSRLIAGRRWFPLWAILHHVGRTSGREYAFPVVAMRTEGGFVIPVPFGEATQWVKNVLAAGSATIRWQGRDRVVAHPRIVDWDEARQGFGRVLGTIVPIVGIRTFVRLDDAAPDASA